MEFRLLVQGDRACFKRPEFAADLVSYDVITPFAARGLLDRLYTAPDVAWHLDEIRVLRPIRFTWMALAELEAGDPGAALPVRLSGPAERRMANVLSDVGYVITAHLEGESVAVHAARCRARIAARRHLRTAYLGVSGFSAEIALLDPAAPLPTGMFDRSGAIDLGWMLYDRDAGRRAAPRFYRPTMIDGVIDLRRRDALILAA